MTTVPDRALAARYPIIPWPRTLEPGEGSFGLGPTTPVTLSDRDNAGLRLLGDLASEYLRAMAGTKPSRDAAEREPGAASGGAIALALRVDGPEGREAYALEATAGGVEIAAREPGGIFYGLQTLRQLVAATPGAVPAVRIEDAPRFSYRGLHLDVGRHFFPLEFIKKYIDAMAAFKLNTFHWHLTEDQGWRLEIRRYPELTGVGAWRKETIVGHARRGPEGYDGTQHGGFYTQDQAREIVRYARERNVTVIPEIEMPGHALAALAAYPELGCTPGPFEVRTTWGISEDIFCPSEETFTFLENVLTEVMEIFPSEYIHIGGDEAPKARWKASPVAQAVIKREGLHDEDELQSWFVRRIETFLRSHGRRLIGWDEILEGGIAPNATVMSWRGTKGGIAAAKQGHDVVMCPNDHLYFDYYQADPDKEPLALGGMTPLEDTYGYEPVAGELTPAEASHVLGAEGCVWTEYMATPEQVEYMAYPRVLALAELAWSPREARDLDAFRTRLGSALALLDRLGVRYRAP